MNFKSSILKNEKVMEIYLTLICGLEDYFMQTERRLLMNELTNEEYREKLYQLFKTVEDNYKLRWFYMFVKEKLRSNN